eukprot:TRINITY_DN22135_c0_g1_i1.p1 TRINITY_DN22135_c0_g1~~TRINITY_DN22135_c0_g1_i1.p1  ORF type:complete len:428 (+),score=35.80 TRINITY_DN22135_c0_g1_i1:44-1327(+)
MGFHTIDGAVFPLRVSEAGVKRLNVEWRPRQGDVFLSSAFHFTSLQRLVVALVEGHDNPWKAGLVDRPYYIEAAASNRVFDNYIEEITSWKFRRCFKTFAMPHLFPGGWPIQTTPGAPSIPPKVVIFWADPRYGLSVQWEVMKSLGRVTTSLPVSIEDSCQDEESDWVRHYFEFTVAWAREAALRPDTVRLFQVERFASHDPKEILVACTELAEFLEIPSPVDIARRLVTATVNRPHTAAEDLKNDSLKCSDAIQGGPLVEFVGSRVKSFQDSLEEMMVDSKRAFQRLVYSWVDSGILDVARLGSTVAMGVTSLPRARLMQPLKGSYIHDAGLCSPCVFALRGVCKDSATMCSYCHGDGHAKTKRASHAKRRQRRLQLRTPSPVRQIDDIAQARYSTDMTAPVLTYLYRGMNSIETCPSKPEGHQFA